MQYKFLRSTLIAVFVLLLTITIFFISLDREKLVKSELQDRSTDFALNISETLRLSVENLHTLSNVLAFIDDIDYEQFKGVALPYFEADPSLLIVEWQPIIKGSDRKSFVNKIRNNGLPDFHIWEPNTSGEPISSPERSEHVPVLYMLSKNPNAEDINTLGLDLAWSPERMESKWQARDSGRARVSNLFKVVTGQSTRYDPLGFAITLPVYKHGIIPVNIEQRKENILGYIAGIYSVEEFTKSKTEPLLEDGFNILLHDRFNNENQMILESGKASQYASKTEINVYGSSFYLELNASTHLVSSKFHILWVILPLSLLLFGTTIFFFLNRLEHQNKKLTEALKKLKIALTEVETLKQREKENIYRATVHGTQHIMNNLLNQLSLVSMEIKRSPDFDPAIAESFEKMKGQALELVNQLSSVEEIEEQNIKDSVRPD